MRALVLAAIFCTLSMQALADPPAAVRRCNGPYNCVTVNTGPCGSLMLNDVYGLTPGVSALTNPSFPRVEGVCGFYNPPYYAQPSMAAPPPSQNAQFPPIPQYASPP